MHILFCRGTITPDDKKPRKGLLCLCHFYKNDDEKNLAAANAEINRRREKNEVVILIPFSFLGDGATKMDYELAQIIFSKLTKKVENSDSLPFCAKEMHLDVIPPGGYFQNVIC
jgi:hypothetical protein